MRRKSITLAQCIRDEMLAADVKYLWAGDPDLCLSAYERSGGRAAHPSIRIKYVIDAARRSTLFSRDGYIRAANMGGRETLHPCFVLATGARP